MPVADIESAVEELEPVVLFGGVGELCANREPDVSPWEFSAYPLGLIFGPVGLAAWTGVASDALSVECGDTFDG